jgi:hypothetical protein
MRDLSISYKGIVNYQSFAQSCTLDEDFSLGVSLRYKNIPAFVTEPFYYDEEDISPGNTSKIMVDKYNLGSRVHDLETNSIEFSDVQMLEAVIVIELLGKFLSIPCCTFINPAIYISTISTKLKYSQWKNRCVYPTHKDVRNFLHRSFEFSSFSYEKTELCKFENSMRNRIFFSLIPTIYMLSKGGLGVPREIILILLRFIYRV